VAKKISRWLIYFGGEMKRWQSRSTPLKRSLWPCS